MCPMEHNHQTTRLNELVRTKARESTHEDGRTRRLREPPTHLQYGGGKPKTLATSLYLYGRTTADRNPPFSTIQGKLAINLLGNQQAKTIIV